MDDANTAFHFCETLGVGSFGRVVRARLRHATQTAALKFVTKLPTKDLESLKREIEISRKLSHPGIVLTVCALETATQLVVIQECALGDLYGILKLDGKFPEHRVRNIGAQLVDALHYIHSSAIIHRDLKPQNVLLFARGRCALCDFGFARAVSSNSLLLTTIKGTPLYMAPEMIQENPYNFSADIWSLGVLMYELMEGRPPFWADNLMDLVKKVVKQPYALPNTPCSSHFLHLLSVTLEKNPSERIAWPALLNHPFFAGEGNITTTMMDSTSPTIIKQLVTPPPPSPPNFASSSSTSSLSKDVIDGGGAGTTTEIFSDTKEAFSLLLVQERLRLVDAIKLAGVVDTMHKMIVPHTVITTAIPENTSPPTSQSSPFQLGLARCRDRDQENQEDHLLLLQSLCVAPAATLDGLVPHLIKTVSSLASRKRFGLLAEAARALRIVAKVTKWSDAETPGLCECIKLLICCDSAVVCSQGLKLFGTILRAQQQPSNSSRMMLPTTTTTITTTTTRRHLTPPLPPPTTAEDSINAGSDNDEDEPTTTIPTRNVDSTVKQGSILDVVLASNLIELLCKQCIVSKDDRISRFGIFVASALVDYGGKQDSPSSYHQHHETRYRVITTLCYELTRSFVRSEETGRPTGGEYVVDVPIERLMKHVIDAAPPPPPPVGDTPTSHDVRFLEVIVNLAIKCATQGGGVDEYFVSSEAFLNALARLAPTRFMVEDHFFLSKNILELLQVLSCKCNFKRRVMFGKLASDVIVQSVTSPGPHTSAACMLFMESFAPRLPMVSDTLSNMIVCILADTRRSMMHRFDEDALLNILQHAPGPCSRARWDVLGSANYAKALCVVRANVSVLTHCPPDPSYWGRPQSLADRVLFLRKMMVLVPGAGDARRLLVSFSTFVTLAMDQSIAHRETHSRLVRALKEREIAKFVVGHGARVFNGDEEEGLDQVEKCIVALMQESTLLARHFVETESADEFLTLVQHRHSWLHIVDALVTVTQGQDFLFSRVPNLCDNLERFLTGNDIDQRKSAMQVLCGLSRHEQFVVKVLTTSLLDVTAGMMGSPTSEFSGSAALFVGNVAYHSSKFYVVLKKYIGHLVTLCEDVNAETKSRANAVGALGNLLRNGDSLDNVVADSGAVLAVVGLLKDSFGTGTELDVPSKRVVVFSLGHMCARRACRVKLLQIYGLHQMLNLCMDEENQDLQVVEFAKRASRRAALMQAYTGVLGAAAIALGVVGQGHDVSHRLGIATAVTAYVVSTWYVVKKVNHRIVERIVVKNGNEVELQTISSTKAPDLIVNVQRNEVIAHHVKTRNQHFRLLDVMGHGTFVISNPGKFDQSFFDSLKTKK